MLSIKGARMKAKAKIKESQKSNSIRLFSLLRNSQALCRNVSGSDIKTFGRGAGPLAPGRPNCGLSSRARAIVTSNCVSLAYKLLSPGMPPARPPHASHARLQRLLLGPEDDWLPLGRLSGPHLWAQTLALFLLPRFRFVGEGMYI